MRDILFNVMLILIIAILIIVLGAILIWVFFAAISFVGECYCSWKKDIDNKKNKSDERGRKNV